MQWTQREQNLRSYCAEYEKIENYEEALKDELKGWVVCHRLETRTSDGEERSTPITKQELIMLGMYFHRPPEELIWMKETDHSKMCAANRKDEFWKLSSGMKGKKHTAARRRMERKS